MLMSNYSNTAPPQLRDRYENLSKFEARFTQARFTNYTEMKYKFFQATNLIKS